MHCSHFSILFGGNFLHGLNIGMQLYINGLEGRCNRRRDHGFPFFEQLTWFAAAKFVDKLRNISRRARPSIIGVDVDAMELKLAPPKVGVRLENKPFGAVSGTVSGNRAAHMAKLAVEPVPKNSMTDMYGTLLAGFCPDVPVSLFFLSFFSLLFLNHQVQCRCFSIDFLLRSAAS